jgi:hypothetical protein
MALQKEVTVADSFGEDRTFDNAYHKVTHISGNKGMMQIVVTTYTQADGFKIKETSSGFEPDLDGNNFIAMTIKQYGGAKC